MSETRLDRFKYRLLKLIDISGFKVFDPVVRLLFREEPRKQWADILSILIAPIIFVCCCLALWTFVAPRHKTNSGEVPKPGQVLDAAVVNHILTKREFEKASDFGRSGDDREQTISDVRALLAARTIEAEHLRKKLDKVKAAEDTHMEMRLKPLQDSLAKLKIENRILQEKRKEHAEHLSQRIVNGKADRSQLLETLREDRLLKDAEKEHENVLRDELKRLSEKPKAVKQAEIAADAAINEVQHLKKRLDYLQSGNRSRKVEAAEQSTLEAVRKLETATTSTQLLIAAKTVVAGELKARKTAEQTYPMRATILLQVLRSLFTVFVGFTLAAGVAIPVGIMCGLNRVVMACLTPIISVFKPVSPVVWLLIFQIVVGAFFLPDPNSFWLFELCGNIPLIRDLGVNPALIFSACTVAMCAVWPALVNTALGVSSIDQDHLNVAKVLKLGLWSRLFKIIIPSSLPLVFAGLRISLGVGWMVLIAAEALSSSEGLGKFVWDEYQNGSSHSFANIIFACFVVGFIGFFLDRIMIMMQRSVSFDDGAAVV